VDTLMHGARSIKASAATATAGLEFRRISQLSRSRLAGRFRRVQRGHQSSPSNLDRCRCRRQVMQPRIDHGNGAAGHDDDTNNWARRAGSGASAVQALTVNQADVGVMEPSGTRTAPGAAGLIHNTIDRYSTPSTRLVSATNTAQVERSAGGNGIFISIAGWSRWPPAR
jgi:hypothetical protein